MCREYLAMFQTQNCCNVASLLEWPGFMEIRCFVHDEKYDKWIREVLKYAFDEVSSLFNDNFETEFKTLITRIKDEYEKNEYPQLEPKDKDSFLPSLSRRIFEKDCVSFLLSYRQISHLTYYY
jgi:hypothetical protein